MTNIESLEDGLQKVKESKSNRGATRIAGWLNRTYGNSRENRRLIQITVSKRKQDRETEELLKKLGETEEQMRNKISWGSDPNKNAI
ncbi:hypothetical protein A3A76_02695 [Candidatus Woesebacteria bacterium RIFCSPLOWO2_01_FULL_39_23]|uniref:Uncharacterized protein n=1 Tax=Candidatus Woesebacteria bacterium RIFCSPHIGHO2_01_FULL_40_22 TaxID=1802499 RepID=A0A1F7YLI9_9BACT|nr:MAG: hypothetical protein A2141_01325 [Candidatus Woesebacteria bacterium RBG_16_40_11]OGM27385.1 MAG: hypothetical protein A2628_01100 [Candidatus Woesebacteria bacterium RIFCSPHIGHO2_01_FULL_40_22]OGM37275.1 MAG: hypothetical protein A3E41_00310 [Candidatus Woesebacteria bacterium RIFCSPHIGHO2_12_FULL_38_9]OGM62557.1 MAG: hypothetical protein A3A76_02695 [Candidatus Woesebacteria bacterium RIFCSPLOWO2_01_FULL_39_23]